MVNSVRKLSVQLWVSLHRFLERTLPDGHVFELPTRQAAIRKSIRKITRSDSHRLVGFHQDSLAVMTVLDSDFCKTLTTTHFP